MLSSVTARGVRGSGQTGDADALGETLPLRERLGEGEDETLTGEAETERVALPLEVRDGLTDEDAAGLCDVLRDVLRDVLALVEGLQANEV